MKIRSNHSPHPDRATLLAWMEGELSWWPRQTVERHIRSCWQCKGQASELESLVCAVSLRFAQLPEPSKVETAKAHWRFREACLQINAAPKPWTLGLQPVWRIAAVSILATAGLAFVGTRVLRLEPVKELVSTPRPARQPQPPQPARQLSVELFRPPAIPSQPLASLPNLEAPTAPVVAPGPTDADLLAVEVQAIAALHRSRFCLNSGITVRRADTAIEITGVVQSKDQRDRVAGVLETIGHPQLLRLRLTEPSSGLGALESATSIRTSVSSERHAAPPIEAWLREKLKVGSRITERELFNLMNAVLRDSEDISSEAWALRHLAEQFPPERSRKLTPDIFDQLAQIVEDHAIALGNGLQSMEARLRPLTDKFPPPAVAEPSFQREAHWQEKVLALQRLSEDAVSQLLESFSDAQNSRDFSALITHVGSEFRTCLSSTADLRTTIPK